MKKVEIVRDYKWWQLDPEVGGYMSVHVRVSGEFNVLTTPINKEPREWHKEMLDLKIKQLKDE